MAKAFDFVNAINDTKIDIIAESDDPKATEEEYVPYLTNRALSYFQDTILFANEMNTNIHLPKRMQFDYLINNVRKRKRFSKWEKVEKTEAIEVVSAYYECSLSKAREIVKVLTDNQIDDLRKRITKGGT